MNATPRRSAGPSENDGKSGRQTARRSAGYRNSRVSDAIAGFVALGAAGISPTASGTNAENQSEFGDRISKVVREEDQ